MSLNHQQLAMNEEKTGERVVCTIVGDEADVEHAANQYFICYPNVRYTTNVDSREKLEDGRIKMIISRHHSE